MLNFDWLQTFCESLGGPIATPFEDVFNQIMQTIMQFVQGTAA